MTSKSTSLVLATVGSNASSKSLFDEALGSGRYMTALGVTPAHASTKIMQSTIQDSFLSERTRIVEQHISELKNPLSPSSLPRLTDDETIEERLFDATANVKILTAQVAMHLDRQWREKLFGQIDSLHDPEEWDSDDEPIQQASFATFLKAICQIKPNRRPGLGLSNGGHLVAAWTKGQSRLTIEFLPNDRVRWVLSRIQNNEPEQYVGQTAVSRLLEGLKPHRPEEWFA